MRIKYTLLPKLKNLTSTEMQFFLYIATKQNLHGHVTGVHNQDVCRNTGMCKQSFYTAMRGLEKKGVIRVIRASDIDYDIMILDNDCADPETGEFSCPEGYINLQRSVFHKKQFKNLKAKEKWMLLYFLHITHEGSGSYRIGTKTFYDKFSKLLAVSKRVIRSYLHKLRNFFSIGIVRGNYYITYLHRVFHPTESVGCERREHEYFVKACIRRNKIRQVDAYNLIETVKLIKQYRKLAGDEIYQILRRCIDKVAGAKQKPKDRKLNAKHIHKLVRKELALD